MSNSTNPGFEIIPLIKSGSFMIHNPIHLSLIILYTYALYTDKTPLITFLYIENINMLKRKRALLLKDNTVFLFLCAL